MKREAGSSDLVLRCYAPQMVTEAYLRAVSPVHDARERLRGQLGFVHVLQRFLLGVLAAEHFGLGLEAPPKYQELVRSLNKQGFGIWGQAARELAKSLLASGKPLIARSLAGLFYGLDEKGGLKATEFWHSLDRIVGVRNTIAHDDDSVPTIREAEELLGEIQEPLAVICRWCPVLGDHPVFYVRSRQALQDGSIQLEVLRFSGRDPEPLPALKVGSGFTVPDKVPFVLSREGTAVLLSPFVVVAWSSDRRDLEARLLWDWSEKDHHFQHSPVRGGKGEVSHLEGRSVVDTRDDLQKLSPMLTRREGNDPSTCAILLDEKREDRLPEFPGFKIIGFLGRGASSEVYLAEEVLEGRAGGPRCALKILHPAVMMDPQQRQRLRREHEILSGLLHPAIVKVKGGFSEVPVPHSVMEYVDGEDLHSAVSRKALEVDEAARICMVVLDALSLAHGREVIHRDLKPSNIMLDRLGQVRLIDFGIALAENHTHVTRTMEALGTAAFAAPEQVQRSATIDHRADLYSMGRVLEFLASGDVGIPGEIAKNLPDGLKAVIRRATQLDPDHRYPSAAEMLADLKERKDARWGGAPVQAGDRLNDSFETHEQVGQEEGIWVFTGAEIVSDERVSLALAAGSKESELRLSQAASACPDHVRRAIRYRGIQQTRDGLKFVILSPEKPLVKVRSLLQGKLSSRRHHPGAARLFRLADVSTGPRGKLLALAMESDEEKRLADLGIPDYLTGYAMMLHLLEAIEGTEVIDRVLFETFRRSRQAMLIALAQIAVLRKAMPTPEEWRVLNGMSLTQLATSIGEIPGSLPTREEDTALVEALCTASASSLRSMAELRNKLAHSSADSGDVRPPELLQGLRTLLALTCLLGKRLRGARALSPVLLKMEDEDWTLLEFHGSKAICVSLSGKDKSHPLPRPALRWLETGGEPLGLSNPDVRARMLELSSRMAAKVRDRLHELLPRATILEQPSIQFGSRTYRPEFTLHLHDEAVCVVDTFHEIESRSSRRHAHLDALFAMGLALKVPYAVMTDGDTWSWYWVDRDRGLELVDGDEAVKAITQRIPPV